MRNVGSCQWSLLGRLLMFATRHANHGAPRHPGERVEGYRPVEILVESVQPAA